MKHRFRRVFATSADYRIKTGWSVHDSRGGGVVTESHSGRPVPLTLDFPRIETGWPLCPLPFDSYLVPLTVPSVWSVGKTYVSITISRGTGASMIVTAVTDPDRFSPLSAIMIRGAATDGGDRIQLDDVGLAVARQNLVRPGVGGGTD